MKAPSSCHDLISSFLTVPMSTKEMSYLGKLHRNPTALRARLAYRHDRERRVQKPLCGLLPPSESTAHGGLWLMTQD